MRSAGVLVWTVVAVLLSVSIPMMIILAADASAQSLLSSPSSSSSSRELERELQEMTKEELEQICLERGFELIKDEIDEETGLPIVSTHQDHVDAAWQCLQLEDFVISDLKQKMDQSSLALSSSPAQEPIRLEVSDESNSTNAIISSPEEQAKQRDLHFKRIQRFVEQAVPLPKPLQILFSHVVIRLVGDVKEVLAFARRQWDAVIGVLRGRIAKPSSSPKPAGASDVTESHQVVPTDPNAELLVGEL